MVLLVQHQNRHASTDVRTPFYVYADPVAVIAFFRAIGVPKRLTILVDYADGSDVADRLNLCDARLIK